MNHSDPVVVWVQQSHLAFFFTAWHKLTELKKVLMVWHSACGLGQWAEGGKVGCWVSVGQLGG